MKTEKFLFPALILIILLLASCSKSAVGEIYREMEKVSNAPEEEEADVGGVYPTKGKKENFIAVKEPMADGRMESDPEPASPAPVSEDRALEGERGFEAAEPAKKKAVKRRASSPGLKAGFADDNKQFNYFLNFLEQYGSRAPHYPIDVRELGRN